MIPNNPKGYRQSMYVNPVTKGSDTQPATAGNHGHIKETPTNRTALE